MKKWIVVAHRMPYNYNDPQSFIVEAETNTAAIQIVQVQLRDLAEGYANYGYKAREYDLPEVKGQIVGRIE